MKRPTTWREAKNALRGSGSRALGGGWILRHLASSHESAIQMYNRRRGVDVTFERPLAPEARSN